MPRTRIALVIAIAIVVAALPAVAHDPDLDPVSWLTGCWLGEGGGGANEECWLHPGAGMMLGFSRVTSEGAASFEFLRIVADAEGIALLASPSGREPVAFRLVESAAGLAVFANPEHDFPQRITYRLSEDGLSARVEAHKDGEWRGFDIVWRRSSLEGPER